MNAIPQLVFFGAGNMAEALVKGILASGWIPPASICMTDIRPERLAELEARYGVRTTTDNSEAVREADVALLCVKPQQFPELLGELRGKNPQALWISIAAGVTTASIETALGGDVRVVRVMPNTPALVCKGAAGFARGTCATEADAEMTARLMRCVGSCTEVGEEDLHAVTALSGSGPAYVFYLVEALLKGAEELGLSVDVARELAVQTVIGAGELLAADPASPETLRARVTSKGGTTAAAIAAFDAAGVGEGLTRGVLAAAARSRELSAG